MTPVKVTEQGRKAFGNALLEYRSKIGLSLDAAAEAVRVRSGRKKFAKSTLNDLENGVTKRVTLDTLFALSQAGYGGMSLSEMADILSDRRLAVCEAGSRYDA